MKPDVEKLIASAADSGWEWFDQLNAGSQRPAALSPEQLAKKQRLAHIWATFFSTEAGRAAIEDLIETTLGRATFVAMLGLPMDAAYGHGVFREGQNAIVYTILKMIAEGRKDNPPPERTGP